MSKKGETFFTSIGCMDGRVQGSVADYGRNKFGALYPDTITEAGLVGQLTRLQAPEAPATGGQAKNKVDQNLLASIKNKINISLEEHHSRGIVIHGHQECAGHPVDDETHKRDVLTAAQVIRSFVPETIGIIPVFVEREGEEWITKELSAFPL